MVFDISAMLVILLAFCALKNNFVLDFVMLAVMLAIVTNLRRGFVRFHYSITFQHLRRHVDHLGTLSRRNYPHVGGWMGVGEKIEGVRERWKRG